jgi:hypothetical protein
MSTENKAIKDAEKTAISYAQDWGSTSIDSTSSSQLMYLRITTSSYFTRDSGDCAACTTFCSFANAVSSRPTLQHIPKPIKLHN